MKLQTQLITLCISVFCNFYGVAQNTGEFKVQGTIEGIDVPYMFIDYNNDKGSRVWDTLFVKNDKFDYKATINKTKFVTIWPFLTKMGKEDYKDREVYLQKMQRFSFFAKPGELIDYRGKVNGLSFMAEPKGTSLNKDYASYIKSLNSIKAPAKGEQPTSEYKNTQIEFIKSHIKSEVSAYILSEMILRKTLTEVEAKELFFLLDTALVNSPFYKVVDLRIKAMDITKPGNTIPEIVTKSTLNGETFNLKSLRGKYVLIDFWGTWCGPCVAEMPTVKKYQQKYKDKLVVLGIDSGDTKDKIIAFVKAKGYTWMQLMSKKTGRSDDFVSAFNVNGFPTKFIVDPNGIIVGKYVGGSEEAFLKLDELLNN